MYFYWAYIPTGKIIVLDGEKSARMGYNRLKVSGHLCLAHTLICIHIPLTDHIHGESRLTGDSVY